MNLYDELRHKQQQEVNSFPIGFAYNDKQFEEQMAKLGLKTTDTNKVVSIGFGGFIRKSDASAFDEMLKRHRKQMEKAIAEDKNGTGFVKDMFESELANHEYDYTRDITDTLDALGLTMKEIASKRNLFNGLQKALRRYR